MGRRLTRTEQTERNRERVLRAARRVFLARGYNGATLEQIAEAAGFSKGVVYSQFDGKGDLFLALLEARIEERAASNRRLAEEIDAERGIALLFEHVVGVMRAEPAWGLLVIEFRVHAARDPRLNRRYAAAHARTIDALADVLATVYERAGEEPPFPARSVAEIVLALGSGAELEQAADPDALGGRDAAAMLTRLLTRAAAAPARGDARAGSIA